MSQRIYTTYPRARSLHGGFVKGEKTADCSPTSAAFSPQTFRKNAQSGFSVRPLARPRGTSPSPTQLLSDSAEEDKNRCIPPRSPPPQSLRVGGNAQIFFCVLVVFFY